MRKVFLGCLIRLLVHPEAVVGGGFRGYIGDYMLLVKRYLFGEIDQGVAELNEFLIVLDA